MPDYYKGTIPILDDAVPAERDILRPAGESFGLVPRDYSRYPQEMFASPPPEMKVIEPNEWDAYYDEQEANQSSLEHVFLSGPDGLQPGVPAFVNLDQDGDGYCWGYSVGHSVMLDRLRRNLLPVRLNPHSVCAIIKKGRDEGGWCGLSSDFMQKSGIAEEGIGPGQWPLQSRNLKYDTPECRVSMAKYKVDESWYDLTKEVWDQKMTSRQLATCGFMNIPAPSDFNWWGHSVCQIRWVRIERNSWGPLILNSWKNWGRFGLAVLRGSQAVANGAVATRLTAA